LRAIRILSGGLIAIVAIIGIRWVAHRWAESADRQGRTILRIRDAPSSPENGSSEPALPRPLRLGEPLPETMLVDQDGKEMRLSNLRGEVLVLFFFYTHCDSLSMCPATTAKLMKANERVRNRGVHGVQFVAVSFDPQRDRPERLREYASRYGADLSSFHFATGRPDDLRPLSLALNTFYRDRGSGVYDHNSIVSVFDRAGILRRNFPGSDWPIEEFAEFIARLAGYPASGSTG
jgi:protein SCO1/2